MSARHLADVCSVNQDWLSQPVGLDGITLWGHLADVMKMSARHLADVCSVNQDWLSQPVGLDGITLRGHLADVM